MVSFFLGMGIAFLIIVIYEIIDRKSKKRV